MTDTDTTTRPNAALVYEVLDLALQHRLDMVTWAGRVDGDAVDYVAEPVGLADLTADCGTTACLAGWTDAYAGYQVDSAGLVYRRGKRLEVKAEELAADLLGIDATVAARLFFTTDNRLGGVVAEIFGPRPGDPS